jgi:hypothetical protein
MINKKLFFTSKFWLSILIGIGIIFRFYKLDWGEGHFFHPDERNIANVAVNISPPLNVSFFTKGTFSYGSLVAYSVYGIGYFQKMLFGFISLPDKFTNTVLLLRFLSAIFSALTVFLIYGIGKKFWNDKVGLSAAVLVAFSPGLIQAAHFGTFEAILSFLYLLTFYFCARLLQQRNLKDFLWSIVFVSMAAAIKINSLILAPISFLILVISQFKRRPFKIIIGAGSLGVVILMLFTILLSPYYLTHGFHRMFMYEQELVLGKIDVFYTRQFLESVPLTFQFINILPYLTNPILVIIFPISILMYFLMFIKNLVKKKIKFEQNSKEFTVLFFWGVLFFSNAFLFTKWGRYMVPTIPFFILWITIVIHKYLNKWRLQITVVLIFFSFIWTSAFMSIYYKPDIRLTASEWIYQHLEDNSHILSETGNVTDIPLPAKGKVVNKNFRVVNFDFYNLDYNEMLVKDLLLYLEKSDYIFIPSRRIFGGMGRFPDQYPLVNRYYQQLFSGNLGFQELKVFTSFPRFLFIEFSDEFAEETWSVFDHPVIRIYEKVKFYSIEDYEKLLKN